MITPLIQSPVLMERRMNPELLVLRVIHVVGGVIWAGTGIFVAYFLLPAMGMAGPAGAPVMGALAKRRLFVIIPTVAVFTMLAGLRLLQLNANGSFMTYISGRSGGTYLAGAVAALAAFIVFMTVNRPAIDQMARLQQQMTQTPEAERGPLVAQLTAIRARAGKGTQASALLLTVTIIAMAVGRYAI